jgi:hypothetical protein
MGSPFEEEDVDEVAGVVLGDIGLGDEEAVGLSDGGDITRSGPGDSGDGVAVGVKAGREKAGEAGAMGEGVFEGGAAEREGGVGAAGEAVEGSAGEDFEADHGGGGIAGESEEKGIAGAAEDEGLTGLNGDAVEEEPGAELLKCEFDDIVLAGGDASGEEEEVGFEALFDESEGFVETVWSGGEDDGDAAGEGDLGGKGEGVGVADLVRERGLVEGDDFVSGCEDRDAGFGVDGETGGADRSAKGDAGVAEAFAGREEDGAGGGFGGLGVKVQAGSGGGDGDVGVIAGGVFDHDDGVRAAGEGGAGHDFDGGAGLERAEGGFAGADFAEEAEAAGGIGGAHSEAIADAAGKGGNVAVCKNGVSEDAAESIREGDGFGGRGGAGAGELVEDDLAGDGEREGRHANMVTMGAGREGGWSEAAG